MEGPGRMMQDANYYVGELRQKLNGLSAEIAKLKVECDNQEREANGFMTFEKRSQHAPNFSYAFLRAEDLAGEVRELQGQMGDYNTLLDRMHTDAELDNIDKTQLIAKNKNQREQKIVDDLFLQKQGFGTDSKSAQCTQERGSSERCGKGNPGGCAQGRGEDKRDGKAQQIGRLFTGAVPR